MVPKRRRTAARAQRMGRAPPASQRPCMRGIRGASDATVGEEKNGTAFLTVRLPIPASPPPPPRRQLYSLRTPVWKSIPKPPFRCSNTKNNIKNKNEIRSKEKQEPTTKNQQAKKIDASNGLPLRVCRPAAAAPSGAPLGGVGDVFGREQEYRLHRGPHSWREA